VAGGLAVSRPPLLKYQQTWSQGGGPGVPGGSKGESAKRITGEEEEEEKEGGGED
jgi:hypothetical protein